MRVNRKSEVKQTVSNTVTNQVVHDIFILDSSGSMRGEKYDSAINGINHDIEEAKKTALLYPNIKSTFSFVEFSNYNQIYIRYWRKPIESMESIMKCLVGDMTALYQTIGQTIEDILRDKAPEDKVLIKIFTDGDENNSLGKYDGSKEGQLTLKNLIQKVQKENNITITFVGTKDDTEKIINNLGIDQSNTLIHNNTGAGVKMSFNSTTNSRGLYMNAVSKGEDVSVGFYSKSMS